MEQITSKLKSWASILEPKTKAQACETAKLDIIHPYLALMPDAHLGKGATVGSVIPTVGAIIPAAVGVDIGCGMMAVQTQLIKADVDSWVAQGHGLNDLHAAIARAVPLSAGAANQKISRSASTYIQKLENSVPGVEQADQALPHWRNQLGTLGSGNHFIEISLDEEDRVWLFLHSGSRGVGNKLASKHIKVAIARCAARGVSLPNRDLTYLSEVEDPEEFGTYIEALQWAQQFALYNREEMMLRVNDCVENWIGLPVVWGDVVACHHNYTVREQHDGQDIWLSRKGAIDAHKGTQGLIPGSMGDRSYVVVGLGNEEALNSAPHGAGRNYSRSAAKATFTREDLDARMAGVAWGRSDAFLDEHPDAYKPIDVVMRDAEPLVEIQHELRQIVNVKGN